MKALGRLFRRRTDDLESIHAEITDFGEALARHSFVPQEHGTDAAVLADYERALDAYEQAKREIDGARDRATAAGALWALDVGRLALAGVDARLAGEVPPPPRPLCFFDDRHGPSTARVRWTPPEGAPRMIDVCAADAIRINEGTPPIVTNRRGARGPAVRRGHAKRAPSRAAKNVGQFDTWPPDLDEAQRATGLGDALVKLRRPDSCGPAVLVVRVNGRAYKRVDLVQPAMPLLGREGSVRAVVPVPADGKADVQVRIRAVGSWSAWLQPVDTLPFASRRLGSRGTFVFRYHGGPTSVTMEHQGKRGFSLTALTERLDEDERVLSGKGASVAHGWLDGPALLHVQARGQWTITFGKP
ncbi:hypothetical protein AB0K34_07105 [Actinomadura sp. NPDC049382]|uniref:hypothetical protein n=1 Tax=Actinomadura sp. NPDC049382 TaxID=3158220 RepID=UPI003431E34F